MHSQFQILFCIFHFHLKMEPLPGAPQQQQQLYHPQAFAPPSPDRHQNLEHRPPTQAVPRNVPPEPPPQHAAPSPQADPLCNFNYITRQGYITTQGNKRTRGTTFVVCGRTASECMYHRKPPEPPLSDAASSNIPLATPFCVTTHTLQRIQTSLTSTQTPLTALAIRFATITSIPGANTC